LIADCGLRIVFPHSSFLWFRIKQSAIRNRLI
jgi:hypothetical protein